MIETDRLLLRRPRLEDDLSEYVSDSEVQWRIGPADDPTEVIERWVRRWERDAARPG